MERGSPFQSNKYFNSHSPSHYINENFTEDMTQDFSANEEDNKEHIELLNVQCSPNRLSNCNKVINENEQLSKDFIVQQPPNNCHVPNELEISSDLKETVRSDISNSTILKFNDSNFTANSSVDVDPMKTLKINIRRKRLCSNSSALSNNDSMMEEKRPCRKIRSRKKRKFTLIKVTDIVMMCDF